MSLSSSGTEKPAMKLLSFHRPLVIGHRGFCSRAPENTLESFRLAMEAGADLVELDYHHSQDNQPIVIHDHVFDRTTDARTIWHRKKIPVASKTAAEIKTLDAGRWFSHQFTGTTVPLLSEALDLIQKGSVCLIERKSGDSSACVRLLRDKGLVNHVVVQSFDWKYLRSFHEQEPSQILGALGPATLLANGRKPVGISRRLNQRWLEQAQKTGARIIVWSYRVSRESVRQAHQRGFKVWNYTINDARTARRLLDIGVDGIITNDTKLIKGIVGRITAAEIIAELPSLTRHERTTVMQKLRELEAGETQG